tara:strand:+ start:370 stop:582 length:213 start_codon:yes stop_codon:yes gene_type:complete
MPKSRHRKDQKSRSKNRTTQLKAQLKKYQKQQMDEHLKLLEDARTQKEVNAEKSNQSSEEQSYDFSPSKG